MTIKTEKITDYNQFVRESQKDMYMRGIFQFCVAWANKMEEKILNGAILADIAKDSEAECYKDDPSLDLTGYMYSCAVSLLSDCWVYGDDLRDWHNKKYGYSGDGVVNTAILTTN